MKRIIEKTINKLGYDIKKIDQEFKNPSLEDVLAKKIKKNPMIFDVGGNKGQSVIQFKEIFKNPIIHSFEPTKSEFDIMYEKFKNDNDVKLNNYALGENIGEKTLNISSQTGASSFNKIKKIQDG